MSAQDSSQCQIFSPAQGLNFVQGGHAAQIVKTLINNTPLSRSVNDVKTISYEQLNNSNYKTIKDKIDTDIQANQRKQLKILIFPAKSTGYCDSNIQDREIFFINDGTQTYMTTESLAAVKNLRPAYLHIKAAQNEPNAQIVGNDFVIAGHADDSVVFKIPWKQEWGNQGLPEPKDVNGFNALYSKIKQQSQAINQNFQGGNSINNQNSSLNSQNITLTCVNNDKNGMNNSSMVLDNIQIPKNRTISDFKDEILKAHNCDNNNISLNTYGIKKNDFVVCTVNAQGKPVNILDDTTTISSAFGNDTQYVVLPKVIRIAMPVNGNNMVFDYPIIDDNNEFHQETFGDYIKNFLTNKGYTNIQTQSNYDTWLKEKGWKVASGYSNCFGISTSNIKVTATETNQVEQANNNIGTGLPTTSNQVNNTNQDQSTQKMLICANSFQNVLNNTEVCIDPITISETETISQLKTKILNQKYNNQDNTLKTNNIHENDFVVCALNSQGLYGPLTDETQTISQAFTSDTTYVVLPKVVHLAIKVNSLAGIYRYEAIRHNGKFNPTTVGDFMKEQLNIEPNDKVSCTDPGKNLTRNGWALLGLEWNNPFRTLDTRISITHTKAQQSIPPQVADNNIQLKIETKDGTTRDFQCSKNETIKNVINYLKSQNIMGPNDQLYYGQCPLFAHNRVQQCLLSGGANSVTFKVKTKQILPVAPLSGAAGPISPYDDNNQHFIRNVEIYDDKKTTKASTNPINVNKSHDKLFTPVLHSNYMATNSAVVPTVQRHVPVQTVVQTMAVPGLVTAPTITPNSTLTTSPQTINYQTSIASIPFYPKRSYHATLRDKEKRKMGDITRPNAVYTNNNNYQYYTPFLPSQVGRMTSNIPPSVQLTNQTIFGGYNPLVPSKYPVPVQTVPVQAPNFVQPVPVAQTTVQTVQGVQPVPAQTLQSVVPAQISVVPVQTVVQTRAVPGPVTAQTVPAQALQSVVPAQISVVPVQTVVQTRAVPGPVTAQTVPYGQTRPLVTTTVPHQNITAEQQLIQNANNIRNNRYKLYKLGNPSNPYGYVMSDGHGFLFSKNPVKVFGTGENRQMWTKAPQNSRAQYSFTYDPGILTR